MLRRERATRKALVRARQIAAVCAVLAIGAAVSAVFGYVSMKRAQEAEARAHQARQMAEEYWARDRHRAEGILCLSGRCAEHIRASLGTSVPVVALSELL